MWVTSNITCQSQSFIYCDFEICLFFHVCHHRRYCNEREWMNESEPHIWDLIFSLLWLCHESDTILLTCQRNVLAPSSGMKNKPRRLYLPLDVWLSLHQSRLRKYTALKYEHTSTRLHGIKFQKTLLFYTMLLIMAYLFHLWKMPDKVEMVLHFSQDCKL
jgi:hypothetical protein